MSRTRDIAIELFGQEIGQKMEPADVYYELARGLVHACVEIEISYNWEVLDSILVPSSFIKDTLFESLLAMEGAKDSAAYATGYKAQVADAIAPTESERHGHLNDLAAIYRALSGPSEL